MLIEPFFGSIVINLEATFTCIVVFSFSVS